MKKYLITGGAGFIGSHLAEALLAGGHEVVALDNLSTGRIENLTSILEHPRFRFVEGDVDSDLNTGEWVAWADTVFHLAAAVGVDLVVKDPVHTIETNVHGTETVLHHAGLTGKRVVLASTSEVYGRAEREQFRETDDLLIGPPTHYRWSYAGSKLLDEFLCFAFHKEERIEPIIVRLFNTVGPRQTGRYGMVLPRFVASALKGEPLRVFGDGRQSRCFCHVQDTVRALIALEELDTAVGEIFNIGTQHSITIADLARAVIDELGSSSEIVYVPYEEAYEPGFEDMQRRMPDITKLQKATGWQPQKSLTDIIREVRDHLAAEG